MTLSVTLALVLLEAGLSFGDSDWSYRGSHRPQVWASAYPSCAGQMQSPIALVDYKISSGPLLTGTAHDNIPKSMTLTNNGHTVALTSKGVRPRITTNDRKSYVLDNVHFHWGKRNWEGSEHTIGTKRFAMEMHAVYLRVGNNGNTVTPKEALVTVTFFEPKSTNVNMGFSKFTGSMQCVTKANTSCPVNPFPWMLLLPKFINDFFWYKGSLTTPPCVEMVTFFIRREPGFISPEQLDLFRKLLNNDGEEISGNFRPLQKRNNRDIFFVI